MRTDTGIPSASQGEQFAHERRMRVIETLHGIRLEGTKGLITLNGGAAIAMLAFVQALIGRQAAAAFKPFAVLALCLFLAGAFLAAICFFFQHAYVSHAFFDSTQQRLWRRASWASLIVAAAAAFGGGAVVAVGVWCVL